jgi:chromosome segregation ATPase
MTKDQKGEGPTLFGMTVVRAELLAKYQRDHRDLVIKASERKATIDRLHEELAEAGRHAERLRADLARKVAVLEQAERRTERLEDERDDAVNQANMLRRALEGLDSEALGLKLELLDALRDLRGRHSSQGPTDPCSSPSCSP